MFIDTAETGVESKDTSIIDTQSVVLDEEMKRTRE